MKNELTLETYKVDNNDVIHLVIKPDSSDEQAQSEPRIETGNEFRASNPRSTSFLHLIPQFQNGNHPTENSSSNSRYTPFSSNFFK